MLQTAAEYASAGTKYKVGCSGTPGTYVDCSGLIYQCLYAAGINPASNIVDHALAIYEYTSANLAADNRLGIEVASYDLQPGDLVFMPKMVKAACATLLFMPETDASMILGRASVFPTAP